MTKFGVFGATFALVFVIVVFPGCAKRGTTINSEYANSEMTTEGEAPSPLYYDFEDVLIPSELDVNRKGSFVYHAPGFTAGVLALTGRIDLNALTRFFENNMAKDNWKLVSTFKSPRTILFFNKMNRSCIINITEGKLKTAVEIWVAPTT